MASPTTNDAILKEIRDCILTDNEDRCKQISPYIHSFWKDLHVKNGCVCIDDRIALPHAIKHAYVDAIHATHPGTWGMPDMATHAWWPYMHRDIATKTAKCNPCVKIGKNLKPIIPANKWEPIKLCKIPNEEKFQIQIDFGGPIYNEKIKRFIFLHVLIDFRNSQQQKYLIELMQIIFQNSFKRMFCYTVYPEQLDWIKLDAKRGNKLKHFVVKITYS